MVITTKTASRNVAFEAAKMRKIAFETQVVFVTRESGGEVFSLEHESLDDLHMHFIQ